jgi:hypothetical protein
MLKYELPNEDLDSLISDEDLDNLIDEYDCIAATSSGEGSSRTSQICLFPAWPDSLSSLGMAAAAPCPRVVGSARRPWPERQRRHATTDKKGRVGERHGGVER